MNGQSRGGAGTRKYGRYDRKPANKRYRNEKRWITNKAKGIKKYMKSNPNWKPDSVSPEVRALL